jgi:hypothetical protein
MKELRTKNGGQNIYWKMVSANKVTQEEESY